MLWQYCRGNNNHTYTDKKKIQTDEKQNDYHHHHCFQLISHLIKLLVKTHNISSRIFFSIFLRYVCKFHIFVICVWNTPRHTFDILISIFNLDSFWYDATYGQAPGKASHVIDYLNEKKTQTFSLALFLLRSVSCMYK